MSVERTGHALDIIEDPDTGEWVCRDQQARANGCVPWNIFQEGAVTQEAIDYMSTVAVMYGNTETEVANLTFTGDLESYSVVIPSASEGVQLAVGAEYRSEWLRLMPDEVNMVGAAGFIGAPIPIAQGLNVKELFVEGLVPIIQDVRGAQDLSVELGYRYSDYSTSGGFSTYKVLGNWAISPSWRLRGGYNRAVRAPNMDELYGNITRWGSLYTDLCEGENPAATLEQCARTGVTAAQYGNIPEVPQVFGGGSNARYGGNPLLSPEVGDTFTAGLVWTPTSIHGLSVTLDYYDIRITEAIGELMAETIHRGCMDTGNPAYCDRIHRDQHGSIWVFEEGYTDLTLLNVGEQTAEGIDLNANYLIGLGGRRISRHGFHRELRVVEGLCQPGGELRLRGLFRQSVRPTAFLVAPPLSRHLGERLPAQPHLGLASHRSGRQRLRQSEPRSFEPRMARVLPRQRQRPDPRLQLVRFCGLIHLAERPQVHAWCQQYLRRRASFTTRLCRLGIYQPLRQLRPTRPLCLRQRAV